MAFTRPISSKLVTAELHEVQTFYTEFHPNRSVNTQSNSTYSRANFNETHNSLVPLRRYLLCSEEEYPALAGNRTPRLFDRQYNVQTYTQDTQVTETDSLCQFLCRVKIQNLGSLTIQRLFYSVTEHSICHGMCHQVAVLGDTIKETSCN